MSKRHNVKPHNIGSNNPRAKLTDHEIELIISLADEGMSQKELAKRFEISPGYICNLIHGRRRGFLTSQ